MNTKSSKAVLIYLPIAAIIVSVIRFFQYITLMDFGTGFFKTGTEAMGALIYILLAVFSAGFIAIVLIRRKKDAAFSVSSDGMGKSATQILGTAFIFSAASAVFKALFTTGTDMLFSLIAAVLYAAVGFLMLKNVVPPTASGHLTLVIALYMFITTALFFNSDLIIINRSENVILLLTYILFTVFLASLARFSSRLETKNTRIIQIISAGLTFIFSATHILPKLIAFLFGGEAIKGMDGISPDAVAACLVSAAFVAMIFTTEKSKDIVYLSDSDEKEEAVPTESSDENIDENIGENADEA